MVLADVTFGQVLLTVLEVFLFAAWLMILFVIISDLFRDHSISGWGKAAWVIFLIFVPFLAALVYLIVRGDGMRERSLAQQQEAQKQLDTYIRQTAATARRRTSSPSSPSCMTRRSSRTRSSNGPRPRSSPRPSGRGGPGLPVQGGLGAGLEDADFHTGRQLTGQASELAGRLREGVRPQQPQAGRIKGSPVNRHGHTRLDHLERASRAVGIQVSLADG